MNEEELSKKLDALDHKITFMAEAYKILHNRIIRGTERDVVNDVLEPIISKVNYQVQEFSRVIRMLNEMTTKESFIGTMSFMAKRLHEINDSLQAIKEDGVKKKIHLDLTMDGYEMVKKKTPKVVSDVSPEEHMDNLLSVLSDRERTVIVYRYGLFDGKSYTYREIAQKLNRSANLMRQNEMKALRKLRNPKNEHLVKKITHMELKKALMGTYESPKQYNEDSYL